MARAWPSLIFILERHRRGDSPPVTPRTADSKFFPLNGIQVGMAVLDVEMTQRCIARHHCRETNPVMPTSQAGQPSVNFGLVACNSGISYWLKKHGSSFGGCHPRQGSSSTA